MKKLLCFFAVITLLLLVPAAQAGQTNTVEIDKAVLQQAGSLTIPLTIKVQDQEVSITLKLTVTDPNDSEPGGNTYPSPDSQTRVLDHIKRMKMLGQQGLYLHNWDDYKWLDSGMLPPL